VLGLGAAACVAMAANNDDWVQFPPRPGASAPKVQNDLPKPAARSNASTPATATDDNWIKFPALPPPKPTATAEPPEALVPAEAAIKPTPAPSPAPALAAAPEPATPAPASPDFVFKAFKFQGNKVYSTQRLQQLLKNAVPQVQDVADLQKAADAVAQLYQNEGLLARVDLLPQDLTEGEVTITITEGRLPALSWKPPTALNCRTTIW